MATLVKINFFLCLLVSVISIYNGLDLKKWFSWFYVIYGFISGFLFGLQLADVQGGLALGALFAFGVIYAGTLSRSFWKQFGKRD